jgi:hypothetical protein
MIATEPMSSAWLKAYAIALLHPHLNLLFGILIYYSGSIWSPVLTGSLTYLNLPFLIFGVRSEHSGICLEHYNPALFD